MTHSLLTLNMHALLPCSHLYVLLAGYLASLGFPPPRENTRREGGREPGDLSTMTGITAPFRRVTRRFIQQTLVRDSVCAIVFECFSRL